MGVCLVPYSIPCSPTTAWQHTTPTPSSLLTTQQVTNNDETAYSEVRDLAVWCQDNNLSLNVRKTKELIVDYRRRRAEQAFINVNGAVVERVESFKFLGIHITNDLSWSKYTKTVEEGTTKPFPPQERGKRFYSCTVESILMVASLPGMASDREALEGSAYGPVHHWGQASCNPGPI